MTIIRNNQKHSFHLVDPSPWPLVSAFSALMLTCGGVLYMHGYIIGSFLWQFGFFMILFMMFCWWRDVVRESTIEGQHTKSVVSGLKMGMLLFILSEIMFFFAFLLENTKISTKTINPQGLKIGKPVDLTKGLEFQGQQSDSDCASLKKRISEYEAKIQELTIQALKDSSSESEKKPSSSSAADDTKS
jgi:hypothetical protein